MLTHSDYPSHGLLGMTLIQLFMHPIGNLARGWGIWDNLLPFTTWMYG